MRFLQRNVHRSVFDHLALRLDELGWVDDPVNFGAEPVMFKEVDAQEGVERIEPTTVALWVPQESADRLGELGGPLYRCDVDMVIDVYASQASFATALASDIKELFRERFIPLLDHSVSTPVQAGIVELMGAWIDRPRSSASLEFAGVWRQVRCYTQVTFEG